MPNIVPPRYVGVQIPIQFDLVQLICLRSLTISCFIDASIFDYAKVLRLLLQDESLKRLVCFHVFSFLQLVPFREEASVQFEVALLIVLHFD